MGKCENHTVRSGFLARIGIVVVALLFSAFFAAAQDDAAEMKRFIETLRILQEYSAEPINADQAFFQGAIPGLVKHLDPHSVFFDKDQFEGVDF